MGDAAELRDHMGLPVLLQLVADPCEIAIGARLDHQDAVGKSGLLFKHKRRGYHAGDFGAAIALNDLSAGDAPVELVLRSIFGPDHLGSHVRDELAVVFAEKRAPDRPSAQTPRTQSPV